MKTLLKIAWRNVWRNWLRSGIVMIAIVLGIWSGLFIMAMTLGLNDQRMNGAINSYLSHIQIHHPKFQEDYNKKYTILDNDNVIAQLDTISSIRSFSERLVLTGMASTARGNYGVNIMGIFPKREKLVSDIDKKLVEGTYLEKLKRNPIVIGKKLADRLGAKIHSKIVLNFQDADNNTIANSFRVEGIFKTANSTFDGGNVYVKYKDIAHVVGLENKFHEIAILCDKIEHTKLVESRIKTPNTVEGWNVISPELGYAQEMMGEFMFIFIGIILIALAFGIINTMLMAILERKRELGMLLSVGMNKRKVFSMILFETIFLALIATPVGMLLSFSSIYYFGQHGIDLSVVAVGLESFGIGSKIFTTLPADLYVTITIMTLVVTFISAIIPARRALKLKPAEAVRAL